MRVVLFALTVVPLALTGCATSSSTTHSANERSEPAPNTRGQPTGEQIADCDTLRPEKSVEISAHGEHEAESDPMDALPIRVEGPVAVVDGEPIGAETFRAVARRNLPPSLGSMTPPLRNRLVRDTVRTAVHRHLVDRAVSGEEVAIDRARLEDAYLEFVNSFPGEEVYRQFLESRQLTREDVRADICRDVQFRELVERNYEVSVTDEEIRAYYEANTSAFRHPAKVKFEHLFMSTVPSQTEKRTEAARRRAADVAEGARSGDRAFLDLAREAASRSPNARARTVGFLTREDLVDALEEPAFELEPGSISDPIRTERGFHVIRLLERKPARTKSLRELRDRIRRILREKRFESAKRRFFERATSRATIEYHYDNVQIRETAATGEKRRLEMPLPGGSGP